MIFIHKVLNTYKCTGVIRLQLGTVLCTMCIQTMLHYDNDPWIMTQDNGPV